MAIIGLFILAAVVKNKDFEKEEFKEKRNFLTISTLFLILGGIGFLFPPSTHIFPNQSLLVFFLAGCAAMTIGSEGPGMLLTRIAWVTLLTFVIMGSFM